MSTSSVTGYAKQYAPWSKSAPWWVVLLQGAVLALIGLWILFGSSSDRTIVMALAAYVLIMSLITIWGAMRRPETRSVAGLVGAGVGLMTSVTILLTPYVSFLEPAGSLGVFGIGLVINGVLALIAVLGPRYGLGALIGAVVNILLGAYVIYALVRGDQSIDLIWWIGVLGIVFGIGLGVYAVLVSRKSQMEASPATGSSAPPAPPAPPAGTSGTTSA
jgi:hypothetical protein